MSISVPNNTRFCVNFTFNAVSHFSFNIVSSEVQKRLIQAHMIQIPTTVQDSTFVYRFFDGSLPGYLSQTLCVYEPTRNLRSSCEKLLKVPKRNTKTFGERSFSFLAPSVWNSLHPASEILLPFYCLNPDSKLTCLRQLSASRISAVFSPRLPPFTSHLPPPPPPATPHHPPA